MQALEKLQVLSEDSQYDLACACGSKKEDRRHRGQDGRWLYPVPLPQGGYSVMLKTLLSNSCANDCKYCPLRSKSNIRRCTLAPEETARMFMQYLDKTDIFGLFLSSGVIGTPDHTMSQLNAVAEILRKRYSFRGYIHLKIIPGASDAAVEEALRLSSAVSLNIETPGQKHFERLSNSKKYEEDIIRPLKLMSALTQKGAEFSSRKCTTQFIVGASDESDAEIVKYMDGIYERLKFNRIYFSAYQPGLGEPDIPGEQGFVLGDMDRLLMREHRLYQADFLLRKYGFEASELLFDQSGNFDLEKDPKEVWAERHSGLFPVNVNCADRETLLRVPGLGPTSVDRILKNRQKRKVTGSNLPQLNVKGVRLEKVLRYVKFD